MPSSDKPRRAPAGAGHITKRLQKDGRYRGYITVPTLAGEKPKRIYRSGQTPREVQAELDKVRRQLALGELSGRGDETIAHFFDRWLPIHARRISPATEANYRTLHDNHFGPIDPIRLEKLTVAMVDQWLQGLAAKGLSPNTQRICRSLLIRMLRGAEAEGAVLKNVGAFSTPPKISRPDPKAFTADELARLLQGAVGHPYAIALQFLAYTGARRGECLGLIWTDLDLDSDHPSAYLQRSLGRVSIKGESYIELTTMKTSSSRRVIPLAEELAELLRDVRQAQQDWHAEPGREPWTDQHPVVATATCQWLDPADFYHWMVKLGNKVGVPKAHPHRLRHTTATDMLAAGVQLSTISAQLGHSSPSITGAIYARTLPPALQQAAQIRAAMLQQPATLQAATSATGQQDQAV